MSDPSPIYKNSLTWWKEKLDAIDRQVVYMREQGQAVPTEMLQLQEIAERYVTKFVIEKLESDNESN